MSNDAIKMSVTTGVVMMAAAYRPLYTVATIVGCAAIIGVKTVLDDRADAQRSRELFDTPQPKRLTMHYRVF